MKIKRFFGGRDAVDTLAYFSEAHFKRNFARQKLLRSDDIQNMVFKTKSRFALEIVF